MMKRAGKIATVDIDPAAVKPSDALNAIKLIMERVAPIEQQAHVTNNVLILTKDEIARRLIYLLQKPEEGE